MTGYGQSSCELADKTIYIEIKSLNSKQLDLFLRLPSLYRDKETEVRNFLNGRIKRGKADVSFFVEYCDEKPAVQINTATVRAYYLQLKEMLNDLGETASTEYLIPAVLRLPESLNNGKPASINPKDWEAVMQALEKASDNLDNFREQEGRAISGDMKMRIGIIDSLLERISEFEKERGTAFRNKLNTALIEQIPDDLVDRNRFEQEVIYYLEKLDITEEKTRLRNHCRYFLEVMNEEFSSGKKLGFVSQEMGREINTLGSKANHSEIQKIVVLMKDELEKIKEQLLNVL